MSDCPRFGKWIGGCRFEPRYEYGPFPSGNINFTGNSSALKDLRPKVYVKDVCIRCGKEIKR